jgi:hypothetical protein
MFPQIRSLGIYRFIICTVSGIYWNITQTYIFTVKNILSYIATNYTDTKNKKSLALFFFIIIDFYLKKWLQIYCVFVYYALKFNIISCTT